MPSKVTNATMPGDIYISGVTFDEPDDTSQQKPVVSVKQEYQQDAFESTPPFALGQTPPPSPNTVELLKRQDALLKEMEAALPAKKATTGFVDKFKAIFIK